LKVGCGDPAATEALPAGQPLSTLAWVIDAIAEAAKPFDFCVSELRPIVRSDGKMVRDYQASHAPAEGGR